jgi:hypothetical protein
MKQSETGARDIIIRVIVYGLILVLAAIAIPSFFKVRCKSSQQACIDALRIIDSGKEQRAMAAASTNSVPEKKDESRKRDEEIRGQQDAEEITSCMSHLSTMAKVFIIYSMDNNETFPPNITAICGARGTCYVTQPKRLLALVRLVYSTVWPDVHRPWVGIHLRRFLLATLSPALRKDSTSILDLFHVTGVRFLQHEEDFIKLDRFLSPGRRSARKAISYLLLSLHAVR